MPLAISQNELVYRNEAREELLMRVLIAVEDSLFGSAIALFVAHHKWPERTEFRVVHILEPLPCSSERAFGNALLKKAENEIVENACKLADDIACSIQEALPKSSVIPQVIEGYAQDDLLEIADEWQPDLIIAGSHGRRGFHEFFMGSTSLRLAAECPFPILLIRPDARTLKLWNSLDDKLSAKEVIERSLKELYRDFPPRKILIAADETELADEVIDFVRNHNWNEPCYFKVLRVYQTPAYLSFLSEEDLQQVNIDSLQEQRKSLRKQALKLRTFFHSPRIEEELVDGDPKSAIVKAAKEWDADLIVVGSHVENAKHPFLGSVSLSILSTAPCSVLLLRQSLDQTSKEILPAQMTTVDVTMI